jgi:hypothetical protein
MKIRMLISVAGTFHGDSNGVAFGDVVDLDDAHAMRYVALHYAEPVTQAGERAVKREEKQIERAIASDKDVETATTGAPVDFPPHQVSKDAADADSVSGPVSEPVKARPGPKPRSGQA